MTTPNRGLVNQVTGTLQPGVAHNWLADVFDRQFGSATINFAADATLELTQVQCDYGVLVFTDTGPVLTGPQDVEFTAAFTPKLVVNNTAEDLTLLHSAGTGVVVAAGDTVLIGCGPDDVVAATAGGGGGGGGGSTQGKHAIPIMAGAIAPSVTGGCAALASIASAANQPDIVTLDFDATTEEYAQFALPMPKSWNEGTITAQFRWSHGATTVNFGTVWGIQAVAVSDDDAIAVAFGTAQTVTDTGGTTNDLYITAETGPITVGGSPAAGDTVFFRVYRKAADGADTLAIDARLHSVVLFITTDADTDA